VITEVNEDTENPELVQGKYLFSLEPRGLDDVRALGQNPPEDERRFATVARVSDVNRSLYQTFAAPLVRTLFPEPVARVLRQLHPHRLRFSMLSDRDPFMWPVKMLAPIVRERRRPVSEKNPLLALEKVVSSWIASSLDTAGAMRDAMSEAIFVGVYGLPALQAAVGLGPDAREPRHAERDVAHELAGQKIRSDLEERYGVGGTLEAIVRALVYVRSPDWSVDTRCFNMLMAIREARPAEERRSFAKLKETLKEQFLLVTLDEKRALETLPALLPRSPEKRQAALEVVHRMVSARGSLDDEARRRVQRIDSIFEPRSEMPLAEQQEQQEQHLPI
jgi:hypothetical protein